MTYDDTWTCPLCGVAEPVELVDGELHISSDRVTVQRIDDQPHIQHACPVVRLEVNLAPDVADALREIAGDGTCTDAIRRCISVQHWINQIEADGGEILVRERTGRIRRPLWSDAG